MFLKALLCACAAVLLSTFALPSAAQVVATDAYQVNYFRYGGRFCDVTGGFPVTESMVVINTGQIGSPIDQSTVQGTICADFYVFDNRQEMLECCGCPLTANEVNSYNVCERLLKSTLTGIVPLLGAVKIVADRAVGGQCDPRSITSPVNGGLRAWRELITLAGNDPATATLSSTSSSPFQSAPLTSQEQQFLGQACAFVQYLGSGRGICDCPVLPTGP